MTAQPPLPVVGAESVRALAGDAYGLAALAAIESAEERVWSSMFLFSIDPADDSRRTVRQLADALVRAQTRGVDVRLLLNRFLIEPDAIDANAPVAEYLQGKGVSVRRYVGPGGRASHSKYLLGDQRKVLVGSGNFTSGALDRNVELALEVSSAEVNRDLARRFLAGWELGTEVVPWR